MIIDENGLARLARNELFLYQSEGRDIVFLVGDHQSTSNEGHYLLADCYCEIAQELHVSRIYTLGGFGVGHLVDQPRVLGAVNRAELREELESSRRHVQPRRAGRRDCRRCRPDARPLGTSGGSMRSA